MSPADRTERRRGAARRPVARLLAATALLLCARPAWADAPDYPASGQPDDVMAWTAAATSIKPASILIITPEMVVALVQADRRPDGEIDASVREEVIDPKAAESMGARSLVTQVAFDCAGHRRRFLGDVAYPRPDLRGESHSIREPGGWTPTQSGTITGRIEAVVCAGKPAASAPAPSSPVAPAPASLAAPARASPPSPSPSPAPPPGAAAGHSGSGSGAVVRVGSFSKEANAHAAAAVLQQALAHGEQGRKVVVRSAAQGKQRYYVVEAEGFADERDAAAFCRSARPKLPGCLVAAQRREDRAGG